MKTQVKQNNFLLKYQRLSIGIITFFVGLIMLIPAHFGLRVWLAPAKIDSSSMRTLENYSAARSSSPLDIQVRYYPDLNIIQYRSTNVWYTLDLLTVDKPSSWFNATNMNNQLEDLTKWAAILLCVVCPIAMMTSRVSFHKTYRKNAVMSLVDKVIEEDERQQSASAASVQQPKTKSQSNHTPTQKPSSKSAQQQQDVTTAANRTPKRVIEKVVTFDSIAGYETTKENMEFIVQCLKNPEMLAKVGATVPSGVLLYGPPGTGKTLMAKAIAGSAGVRFYSANASEFVNTWVGKGASNVRALYDEAKAHAPSVVFIDEIDAIGTKRNSEGNQEYRQTLNALLTEMDGMDKERRVMTIAATNAFEDLDPALIRPGRFDRKIMVPLPSYNDRLAIINHYAMGRSIDKEVSLEKLAKDTTGLAGAGLSTLFNEASIRAVMHKRDIILSEDIDAALTQILTNGESVKSKNKDDLKIAAYHEAGHAVIMKLLCQCGVPKVSIVGSTTGMVGMTIRTEDDSSQLMSVSQVRNRIIAAYGGRAAEEIVFGKEKITTGASRDIEDASLWIRDYLQYGSDDNLLSVSAFSGNSNATENVNEAKALATQTYQEAVSFLQNHRDELERVAQALLEKDTLLEPELEFLLNSNN